MLTLKNNNNESRVNRRGDNINSNSSLLLTQYSSQASQLIRSFSKNILFVMIILIVITIMTIFDLFTDLRLINVLSDEIIDSMIVVVSLFLILFTILIIKPVFRSQRILDKWSNLFDKIS